MVEKIKRLGIKVWVITLFIIIGLREINNEIDKAEEYIIKIDEYLCTQ